MARNRVQQPRARLAGVAVVVLALAACGGAEDATPSGVPIRPTPTPTVTPEPTDTAAPTPSPAARLPGTYLALGDSLAVGVGATSPNETGYVARVHRALADAEAIPSVAALRNLAVSGETSTSMIRGGQLASALEAIEEADPPVSLVTLDIGGNDLLRLLATDDCAGQPQGADCLRLLALTVVDFEANYRLIVEELVDALEEHAPHARLAVMAYFNPFSGTDAQYEAAGELALVGADGRIDCEADAPQARGMNDAIVCVGEELGAIPVDVQPRFIGLGLELTHIGARDIHANDAGYAVAEEVVAALEDGEASP